MLTILMNFLISGVIKVLNCEEQAGRLDIHDLFPSFKTPDQFANEYHNISLDINDLFPSFKEPDQFADVPADEYHNISLDIEKLDINKLKYKITEEIEPKLLEEDKEHTKNGRRYLVRNSKLEWWKYLWAYHINVYRLHCDMILQMIYMAKGQITIIENNPNVNTQDTGYRAGFISNKCQKIFKKLGRILGFMKKWNYSVTHSTGHIVLHHRSVRLHIDFLYYYWVLINLDKLYRQRFGDKYTPRLPQSENSTGGVSIEVVPPVAPQLG